jgi:hypothetical protein
MTIMAYEVTWLVAGRIILDKLSGNIQMDEIATTSELITNLVREGSPKQVHLIVHILEVNKLPVGINVGKVNQYMKHTQEPNLGWTLVITTSMFLRFLASVVTQVAGGRFRAFATYEEALAFLQELDSTLSLLPEPEKVDSQTPSSAP